MVFGFLLLRLAVVVANWLTRPVLKAATPHEEPLVSVLVPARNEEHSLPRLLQSLLQHDYPHLQVVVLNDHSEDETNEVVQQFMAADERMTLILGEPLPEGWLGKNWACHQLAQQARGEYLLFLDADVVVADGLVTAAVAEMQQKRLSLLSLFPRQETRTWGEWLVVPLMHYLLLSLLPLRLIYSFKLPAFAAANGQFMLFSASSYRQQQWHRQVRGELVEDVEIMRSLKSKGQRGETLLGSRFISCRMYRSLPEGVQGFSKNLLGVFGESPLLLGLFLVLDVLAWLVLPLLLPLWLLLLGLVAVVVLRALQSVLAEQPPWLNVLLHPLQMVILASIAVLSIWKKYAGHYTWKGRSISRK